MRLGPPIQTEIYSEWRFVDDDLYDINQRVRNYDKDARLVCEDGSRRLGLARWVKAGDFSAGGAWLLACYLTDPVTGEQLVGEPDARVLTDMRNRDFTLVANQKAWRKQEKGKWLGGQSKRHRTEDRDQLGQDAERFVHEWRKARGKTQNRVYV